MTTTRQMPIYTAPACRQIPGFINAAGRMICGCCNRTVGDTGTPTASVLFDQS